MSSSFGDNPITTHVLNTSTGNPSASLPVKLEFLGPHSSTTLSQNSKLRDLEPKHTWAALTNSNGRVTAWKGAERNAFDLQSLFEEMNSEGGGWMWRLVFVTDGHLSEESWWSDVEVKFRTDVGDLGKGRTHWHVPLLISEFGMSTYRGS
ncbi:MAG: hypothetical protein Q9162_004337 [Coniocarpon cinnabarinum]